MVLTRAGDRDRYGGSTSYFDTSTHFDCRREGLRPPIDPTHRFFPNAGFPDRSGSPVRGEGAIEGFLDQTCSGWPNARRPVDQPFGRPFQVALMGLGSMGIHRREAVCFVAARVSGDAHAVMEDLDGHGRKADVELTMQ